MKKYKQKKKIVKIKENLHSLVSLKILSRLKRLKTNYQTKKLQKFIKKYYQKINTSHISMDFIEI